ncbi:radical SAM family heme chaperone HemW [Aliiroseovarius sp. YM-037]|uniref:radical SAM family heme chaperone HemW n=1 Tax=Aliiroseovarius sp. YM-037 TaxID=3341728 RepID=UPI003A813D6C
MRALTEDWQNGGFGLYLHWPFCQSKCPYCDFNSHVSESIDQTRWKAAYLSEIERVGALTEGRALNTIYFGGGTPSLMEPDLVAAILQKVRETWALANDAEITLEANPGSVEVDRFRGYRDAGVNRVSLGVQALDDAALRKLGRLHSVAEATAALGVAREVFDRVSFDLIYARQDQTLEAWRNELTTALSFQPDHLSLYQLTVEDGTAFGDRFARGRLPGLPAEDTAADMYHLTQALCADAGLPAYEVSNHAAPGNESRHNMIYWRYGDYAGIGPGAHGRLTLGGEKRATETHLMPQSWLNAVEQNGSGETGGAIVPQSEQAAEYLMMGLRVAEGVDTARYAAMAGAPVDPGKIAELADLGLVENSGQTLRATNNGRAILNGVLRTLMADA